MTARPALDLPSLLFCAGCLAAVAAVSAIAYPFAALPEDTLQRAATPAPPEDLPDIHVGGGFGRVAVIDLLGYWIENPPKPAAAAVTPSAVRHFGGC